MLSDEINVGVIVGRFQVPSLDHGHAAVIAHVLSRHKEAAVMLGVSPVSPSAHNPLSFEDRKEMILGLFPGLTVLPIDDCAQDSMWSANLDEKLESAFPAKGIRLYGGQASFIDRYNGSHKTETLDLKKEGSAKQSSKTYRDGVIQATMARYPTVHPTVDIAILSDDGKSVLLGRKPNEDLWRLPGGFAEPESESYEDDARREAEEETSVQITKPRYIGSFKIDDWRYAPERDKIKTLLFTAKVQSGIPAAGDDLAEVKWFKIDHINDIVQSHRVLIDALRDDLMLRECSSLTGDINDLPR